MKRLISVVAAILFFSNLPGQIEFSFQIVFQDAIGNSDTLILGYDDHATDSIDESLGEENLFGKWDSIFEVRVTNAAISRNPYDGIFNPSIQTKKQIVDYQCSRGHPNASSGIYIDVMAIHWPILVTWDSSRFSDYCNLNSHIGFVGIADFMHSLKKHSSFSTQQSYMNDRPSSIYFTPDGDTIASVFWLSFADSSNTTNTQNIEDLEIDIFPNPSSDFIAVRASQALIKDIKYYNIINLNGVIIKKGSYCSEYPIDIRDIQDGMYILQLFRSLGTTLTWKFMKN